MQKGVAVLKDSRSIAVIGGDERQVYLSNLIEKYGYKVEKYGIDPTFDTKDNLKDAILGSKLIFLPLPLTKDGYKLNSYKELLMSELIEALPSDCNVLAGKIPPMIKDYFKSCGVTYFDYFDNNEYVWRNADITAEGAVSILMNELDISISDSNILVCGYGRIGKCLSQKLNALGAAVTVAARREDDRLLASFCGKNDVDSIDFTRNGLFDLSKKYDAIINTVPSRIFDSSSMKIYKDKLFIELASQPYGGEPEFLKKHCKKYILASGIPGKYAPKSAANAVFCSLRFLIEKGEQL